MTAPESGDNVVTAFKPGDKVLIETTVDSVSAAGDLAVRLLDGFTFEITPTISAPVTLIPHVDPELVDDMVVMSEDRDDDRRWHYLPFREGDVTPFYGPDAEGLLGWRTRLDLPERIRPVFDPREVTS